MNWEDPIQDEEEDENVFDQQGFVHGRDAVIFLIDASSDMFISNDESTDTPFSLALKCARSTLTNKIISNMKDLTALVLFGTDKTKNARGNTDFKHVYVYHDLCEPGAERILETEELMEMDVDTFKSEYGHSEDYSLTDALWICSIMFSNCKHSLSSRRILLFTTNDNPHEKNVALQNQAKIKAKDLHESNIDLDLFPIKKPGQDFDCSVFFKDIILSADDDEYKFFNPADKFEDLLTRVRCKDHKKRPLGNLPFTIGSDVKIQFKMYKLVSTTTKPTPVKLFKENNAELTTVSSLYLSDTNDVLLKSDIKKYLEYGGRKIFLSQDEVKQIKHFDDPGLLLLGFKPQSCLKTHYHLKQSLFLYPDEKAIQGSARFCNALMVQCQKKDYVPICRLIVRRNTAPAMVALLPQMEEKDSQGNQIVPPGFHAIFLPFLEDIRHVKGEKRHDPPEELVEKSKDIIKKLQFSYHPQMFENPALQKHWRNIEALALNREAPEEIIDYTVPDEKRIEDRAGRLIEEFKKLMLPSAPSALKRGATDDSGPSSKSSRTGNLEVPDSLEQAAADGSLSKYKVNELKEFCRNNGLRCPSKKADLIEEIVKFYQKQT